MTREAAALLCISRHAVARAMRQGRLAGYYTGRCKTGYRIAVKSLNGYWDRASERRSEANRRAWETTRRDFNGDGRPHCPVCGLRNGGDTCEACAEEPPTADSLQSDPASCA